jgi:hypothetical protein
MGSPFCGIYGYIETVDLKSAILDANKFFWVAC